MRIVNTIRILSLGAGWQSSLMAFKYPYDEIIFADTGEESRETYSWLKILRSRLDITIIDRTQTHNQENMYDYYMKESGIPTRKFRSCTDKFKIRVIRKYLRNKYGKDQKFIMDIGITLDEYHRMRESDVKYITNNYPLITDKYTAEMCRDELISMGFSNIPRSGCYFCPFEKKRKFIAYTIKYPSSKQRVIDLENNALKRNPKLFLYDRPLEKIFAVIDNQIPLTEWLEEEDDTCDGGYCFV